MTIRHILLLSFIAVGMVPATLVAMLAFERSRAAMETEIESGVRRAAVDVSTDVDRLLHERMLNATTWHHLEVMQDLRLGDVDKRLARFLSEMKQRHGHIYLDLHATDTSGVVVASSQPQWLGRQLPTTVTRILRLPGDEVRMEAPHWIEGRSPRLRLRSSIASSFTKGTLGDLVLDMNAVSLEELLDRVAGQARQALLLDADGRVIGASTGLRERGLRAGAMVAATEVDSVAARLLGGPVILAASASSGVDGNGGLAWTTWILQSRAAALAPVQRMAKFFTMLLFAVVLITIVVAYAVAARIARPVQALTRFTRAYLLPGAPPAPPPQGPGELGELNRSFVGLVLDLQRSQQTLIQASKLAAVGEVTALMAHEVRTPLGILRSSAQMLRGERALSTEGQELLNIIESETTRLNRLVGSMLDSSRTRPPQMAAHDMHALIDHAVALLAAQSRARAVKIEIHSRALHTRVDCDAEQVIQVLLNLVMNALQILPTGGRIDIETRDESDRLVIEVADDGPGIAAEDRARIFEPFVYKREGGVGLGLAVVRQIMRSHGGDITADVSEFGGALFRAWLPLRKSETT